MKFDMMVLNPSLGEMGALVRAAEHSQMMNWETAIAVTFPG